ncbi:MAG: DUF4258 domain-containing protein [Deltaproteobacteria bacterium]|nr:MAG: DUF4258 domain-containing protein [Deltaproteobacteria bacterium]
MSPPPAPPCPTPASPRSPSSKAPPRSSLPTCSKTAFHPAPGEKPGNARTWAIHTDEPCRGRHEGRGISVEWVRRALEHPHLRIPDPADADLLHALVGIPERDNRVLRVVYNKNVNPWRVVKAYFDRAWKGML